MRKLTSEDKATWDQVLDQILFAYRCCVHTSTGEAPYTLVYARDPPLPIHNSIKVVEPYKGDNELGKRIEQSRVSLSIAAKWLSKMRDRQKRHYLNKRSTHPFKVGNLVILMKDQGDKMNLKWVPNYRVIKLTSAWSAVVENQTTGKTKSCKGVTSNLSIPMRIGNSSPVLWEELSLLTTWITSQTLTLYLTMTSHLTSLMLELSIILEKTSRDPQS